MSNYKSSLISSIRRQIKTIYDVTSVSKLSLDWKEKTKKYQEISEMFETSKNKAIPAMIDIVVFRFQYYTFYFLVVNL